MDKVFKYIMIATAKIENEFMILVKDHANNYHNLTKIIKIPTKVKAVI